SRPAVHLGSHRQQRHDRRRPLPALLPRSTRCADGAALDARGLPAAEPEAARGAASGRDHRRAADERPRLVRGRLPDRRNADDRRVHGWASMLGGVLAFVGLGPGWFLENVDELYESVDTDDRAWEAFLAGWYGLFGSDPTTVAQV